MSGSAAGVSSIRDGLARILRQCLEDGARVEIDGLGLFRPDSKGGFAFRPAMRPKVFIAYVLEDAPQAERLYGDFRAHGFDAWLDRKRLMPGQNWPRSIEHRIEISDFFVPCFSVRSTGKRGRFQSELRYALDCAKRIPLDEIYLIPVRLDECRVPARIQQEIQYVDLFPDWDKGFARILEAVRKSRRANRSFALNG